jgi:phage terminase large subunit-like protein
VSDSLAKQVAQLPLEEQEEWLDNLILELRLELARNPWWFIGRPEQIAPLGDWVIWLILAGRGFGKTRAGAENLIQWVLDNPTDDDGTPTEWAVIAETFSDCRKICVEGPSGIIRVLTNKGLIEGVHYHYNRSLWQIVFNSGQIIHMLGADNADVGRGLNLSGLWADELCKWRYALKTWQEGLFPALRIGKRPRAIVTTTPKPGHPLVKIWLERTTGAIVVTRGRMDDNKDNLSAAQLIEMHELYDGTRIGRQEIEGEFLTDVPGALWNYDSFKIKPMGETKSIVIAVDPAITNTPDSDETGIVACAKGLDGEFYVLGDWSGKFSSFEWARRVDALFKELKADRVIVEKNQGGDAWEDILHNVNPYLPVKAISAKVSKRLRAGPVAALYEQGRVWHVEHFDKLENQMMTWEADDLNSPDRLDALVHALTELSDVAPGSLFLKELADVCEECRMPNTKGVALCAYCRKPMKKAE